VVGYLESGGVKTKQQVVENLKERYPVTKLCRFLRISRSGYYAYFRRKGTNKDKEIKELIQTVYMKYHRRYGYRQTQLFLLQDHSVHVNHKKVLRLMQEMGIRSRIRRKYRYNYASSVAGRFADNLLERKFYAAKPNQIWVTDVTQYRVGEAWIYLSAIKDLFNNEIVAYRTSFRNDNELVLQTFSKAFEMNEDVTGLIVHSDQGFQYTSHAYHDMLPKVGAQISMSRRGNCHDNASMESFFSHLKTEGLYPYDIRSLDEAQRRIEEYIHFYNNGRPQRKLKKLTPIEYRRQLSA
jgi:putative transposase